MNKYIFINHDIKKLKKEIVNVRNKQFKRLIEQSNEYFSVRLPEEHPKKSTTFMGVAIANLALTYLVTEQEQYLEEAKRWMNAVTGYEKWGNAHLVNVDLSASWIMYGLSLGYNWLYDYLTESEKEKYKAKLILQSEIMYDFKVDTEGKGWSTAYWQNHNWINLNGLATAGYALKGEYDGAQKFIDIAKDNFEIVFDSMADDGSDYEGVVYWRYGAMWLFVYAHLLKNEENIDYFKTSGFLKDTFYYRLYQAVPNLEETVNYGDCHDRRSGHSPAVYYKVAAEYNNGHAQLLGNFVVDNILDKEQFRSGVKPGILPEAFLEFLWFEPSVKEEEFDNLPLVKHFEDLGLVIVRSSWEKDATHLSFKSGHPGGKKQWKKLWELKEKGYDCFGLSHQHPDNNSFILHGFGSYLTIDDGYNRNVKARHHNLVVVDDDKGYPVENVNSALSDSARKLVDEIENFDPVKDFISEITFFKTDEKTTIFTGECGKMYDKDLKITKNERTFICSPSGYFIMVDKLNSDLAHNYKNIIHTDTVAKKVEDNVYEYKNGLGKLDLFTLTDNTNIDFGMDYVKAVMTTQEPDNYRETFMKTIEIQNSEKSKQFNFVNILSPKAFYDDSRLNVTKTETDEFIAGIVKGDDFEEMFIIPKVDKEITFNGVTFKGELLFAGLKDGKVLKCNVKHATMLTANSKEIINTTEPNSEFMEV